MNHNLGKRINLILDETIPVYNNIMDNNHFVVGQELVKEYYQSGELKGAGKVVEGKKKKASGFSYYPSGKKKFY